MLRSVRHPNSFRRDETKESLPLKWKRRPSGNGNLLKKPVVCLAHITNSMATREDDFEKGATTAQQALDICAVALAATLDRVEGGIHEGS